MRVIRKRPGEKAEIINIANTLQALQTEVGGGIDAIASRCDNIVVIFNSRGKQIEGYQFSMAVESATHKITDCIAGTAILVEAMEDDFIDLTDAMCAKYIKLLNDPERVASTYDNCPVIQL